MSETLKKPLTLQEVMRHAGPVYVEFRAFPEHPNANGPLPGIVRAEKWVDKVRKHYGQSRMELGKDYRYWDAEPSKAERDAAPWED